MSDPVDPFEANPYQPPSERSASANEPVQENAADVAPDQVTDDFEPTDVEPAAETTPAAAPSEPVRKADSFTHRFESTEAPTAASFAAETEPNLTPEAAAPEPEPEAEPKTVTLDAPTATPEPEAPEPPAKRIPESMVFPHGSPELPHDSEPKPQPPTISALPVPPKQDSGHIQARGTVAKSTGGTTGKRRTVGLLTAAVIGAAAGVGGAAGYEKFLGPGSSALGSLSAVPHTKSSGPTTPVEQVASAVLPSVVQINISSDDKRGFGTGIIISGDGEILTNNHVVEDVAKEGSIVVAFIDGTNAKAKVIGRDPLTDIAVIKANGKSGLTPATLGTSSDLRVGQTVVAVGSPFGLESSVTSGIVSSLNRPVTSADSKGEHETTFPAIQTDAAINPGNSGGPLVDLTGRVIGINSAIDAGGSSFGLGFAIPIDLAKNVAEQLVKGDKVQHARIGVRVTAAVADDDITTIGAEIKDITENSAGAKAGLRKGDVITAVNSTPIGTSNGLVAAIRAFQPGETVTVTYLRDGKPQKAQVKLDSDGGELKP